jgi:hypothetical protein
MMSGNGTKPEEDGPVDPEACWKLIERVAASSHLNRAPRLREFLFYVGNKSLKEGISEVHEQEIGSVVFGRLSHYDTSQDNIVRVNATELRKRIDAYFVSDGLNEPLIFQIPRGGYKPVFRRQEKPAAAPKEAVLPPEPAKAVAQNPEVKETPTAAATVRDRYRIAFFGAVALFAILLVVCLLQWNQNRALRSQLHPWQNQAALAAFWSRFMAPDQETDIVVADTSFALVQDLSGQQFSLRDYLNGTYANYDRFPGMSDLQKSQLSLIASRLNGSIGDFVVAERIRTLDPTSSNLVVKFARAFTPDSIKLNNTILIGGRKSNPWVNLFSDQMNFLINFNQGHFQSVVKNLQPRAGELQEYDTPIDPFGSSGYSIIACLPNPSRTAESLIIEGTDSQATNAAGEFITSEAAMETLRKRFPDGKFSYFEVLLKTTRLNNTPFKADIVAFRLH